MNKFFLKVSVKPSSAFLPPFFLCPHLLPPSRVSPPTNNYYLGKEDVFPYQSN